MLKIHRNVKYISMDFRNIFIVWRMKMKEKSQVIIRMPVDLKEQLHMEAGKKGISFNSYVLLLIGKARQGQ